MEIRADACVVCVIYYIADAIRAYEYINIKSIGLPKEIDFDIIRVMLPKDFKLQINSGTLRRDLC